MDRVDERHPFPGDIRHAIYHALELHWRQTDDNGEPYIFHPLRVMFKVKHLGEKAQIVAVLHDAVEDQNLSLDYVRSIYGGEIRDALDAVSKREGEKHKDYIERVAKNDLARSVKLADIADNMDPARMTNKHGLYSRYAKAYRYLTRGVWD